MSIIIKEFDLDNVFQMSEILNKMDLQVKTDKIAGKIKTEKLESTKDAAAIGKEVIVSLGADIAMDFAKNIFKAKTQVYKLIADLTGKEIKEVKKMNIKDLKNFFKELVTQKEFKDFFS